jgi:hypothetical protein
LADTIIGAEQRPVTLWALGTFAFLDLAAIIDTHIQSHSLY